MIDTIAIIGLAVRHSVTVRPKDSDDDEVEWHLRTMEHGWLPVVYEPYTTHRVRGDPQVHPNAPLTPEGRRRLAVLIVDESWTVRRAAERFQCSPATASRWARLYREGLPLTDRSSRPHCSPARLPRRTERRIVGLRVIRQWGPHRIGYHLGLPRATVGRVLGRYRLPLLAHVEWATGVRVRAAAPLRYEHEHPGDLVHVDIKKLGRIPDGGGHRPGFALLGATAADALTAG